MSQQMSELKALSSEAIPKALERAERYRLLSEPEDAESICLDILEIAPDNQPALELLLLSRTDQLDGGDPRTLERARRVLPRLASEYDRCYYGGLICERQAKRLLHRRGQRGHEAAYDWLRYALEEYEQAIELRAAGDDEAILRWNTCVRLMKRHGLQASPRESIGLGIE